MDCNTVGYFLSASYVCTQCYTGCARCTGTGSNQCTSCIQGSYYLQPSPNSNTCATSCPYGYEADETLAACVQCSSTQVWYNEKCLDSCPDGYVKSDSGGCGKCSDPNLAYFNHTCVTNCPLKNFRTYNNDINQYECESCYLGCDSCVDGTSSGCTGCSEGFFYFDNSCNTGCPSDMYANPISRTCELCQPPCLTCSKPNTNSCTSCPAGNFLLNGTCVTSCPSDYYQGFLGESEVFKVPACLPKLILKFELSLTTQARIININFNYGIVNMIQAIAQKIQIEIANTQIDDVLFVLSPVTESKIQFGYLGDQTYSPYSLLKVTIDLDTEDFNKNSYQQFQLLEKTATIQLKEIYTFSTAEQQLISSTSSATNYGGSTIATIQAVSSVAQGALSLSLMRLQIAGEIVQLLRLIAIRWPPNIAEYFATSYIDPTSIMLPVDFTGALNVQLEDRNHSMPRIFDEYELSPFFSENYNNELSNLLLWVSILGGGSILIGLLKKVLKEVTSKTSIPKKFDRKKKYRYYFIKLIHKLHQLMNRIEVFTLCNFLFVFLLSIYQPGILWSLLNMRYSSTLLEPPTVATRASLALGILFFLFFLALFGLVSTILLKNMKYLLQTADSSENSQREERIQRYQVLFEDVNRKKILQILFLPISLLKSLVSVAVLSLMTFSPMAQISIIWVLSTAFILYMMIYQPIREKRMRIITFLIELLSYGCVTLGLIFGIIERYVEVDATTAVEMGLLFLILTICSTLGGGILSLIQVLQLVKDIYEYVKEQRAKTKRVLPITDLEPQTKKIRLALSPEGRGKLIEEKVVETCERSLRSNLPSMVDIKELSEHAKMLESIGKLSPSFFEKGPKGQQLLGDLKEWWRSTQTFLRRDPAHHQ